MAGAAVTAVADSVVADAAEGVLAALEEGVPARSPGTAWVCEKFLLEASEGFRSPSPFLCLDG